MGSYLSRSNGEVQEVDISSNSAYRYPPKTGNYFSSHFIMGGNKFETMQPEAYLFGENSDLNFLGPKPYNVPYKVSSPSQPVRALRCLVNIRKDSLRLVKVPSALNKTVTNEDVPVEQDRQITAEEGEGPFLYNIEFTFDADCPCSITIYYNATEEMFNKNVIYSPDPARDSSDTVHFNPGCNQQFCLPTHRIDPAKLAKSSVDWTKGYTKIPIVIQVCADCGPNVVGHSHITYAEFYKPSDSTWSIRAVKQKQAIDGVCYLIQEIFGIENKNPTSQNTDDNDDDDNNFDDDGSDCVVCLSETRDTLILPCKHLCLCSSCANQLRYQQSGCPICRQSFRALLQIRAVRKKTNQSLITAESRNSDRLPDANNEENEEDEAEVIVPVPQGYQVVPLIEAIKGDLTSQPRAAPSIEPSTSVTNVTVVDETIARVPTPDLSTCPSTTSSGNIVNEDVVSESDSDAEEPKIHPESPVLVKEAPHAIDKVEEDLNAETENKNEYEEIPEQEYSEIPPADVATTVEPGVESAESQNSTKELLHESEKEASGDSTVDQPPASPAKYTLSKDGSIEI